MWITDLKKYGIVKEECKEYPRSYVIKSGDKTYRRNRTFIIPTSKARKIEEARPCDLDFSFPRLLVEREHAPQLEPSQQIEPSNSQENHNISNDQELVENNNNQDQESVDQPTENESIENDNEPLREPLPVERENACDRPKRERRKPNWFLF